ncbi:MAG: helix-turn-helix domain-containing protein [Gammaproteobacteria bacterium]|nr:helix-turn-helix domain-containing protein [Gammaproteobacteria bacterium]
MTTDVIPDFEKRPEEAADVPGTVVDAIGPGRRLLEARVALGLSQADVCRQLHLEPKIVTALEADDYKKLPPPTFVSGYLRNYARLVNLPVDVVMADYERLGFVTQPPVRLGTTANKKPEHKSDKAVRITSYLIALAVIVALVVWWQYQENSEPQQQITAPDSGAQLLSPEIPSELPAQPLVPQAPGAISPPGVEGGAAQPQPGGAPAAPVPSPQSSAPVPVAPAAASAQLTQPPSASLDRATVQLRFEKDSWVEINDANGKRLFYAIGKAGEVKSLQGPAPFDVVLGHAPGVKIEYNGVPFDQKPYTQGEVATFTLGKPVEATR